MAVAAAWPRRSFAEQGESTSRSVRPRVLIVDDHTLVRAGMRLLLQLSGDCQVIGEAGDGQEAVRLAFERRPDVVLVDIDMPRMNGLEVARRLAPLSPRPRVLLLITHALADQAEDFLEAGVSGVLLKESSPDELALAVRQVHEQHSYIASGCLRQLLAPGRANARRRRGALGHDGLTARERELLRLVGDGLSNREIAAKLFISVKTVEAHKSNIISRLGLRGSPDLMRYALRKAWSEVAR